MRPIIFKKFFHIPCKTVKGCTLLCQRQCCTELQGIRDQLNKYEAGSVDLIKDEDTGIAVITLNNPGKKNALSGRMMVELADHVTDLGNWKEGRGLILRGANNTFCSGADLTTVSSILTSQDGARMSLLMHDTLTRLHALPLVSMALLQGVTVGGGAEIATACDIRTISSGAKVGFVQVKMGITTGWGGTTGLLKLLGRSKALDLLCSGRLLTAEEAQSLGFSQHLISQPAHHSLLEEAQDLFLKRYCIGPVPLIRAIKETVAAIDQSTTKKEALQKERAVFAEFWGGELQKAALEKNIKHS